MNIRIAREAERLITENAFFFDMRDCCHCFAAFVCRAVGIEPYEISNHGSEEVENTAARILGADRKIFFLNSWERDFARWYEAAAFIGDYHTSARVACNYIESLIQQEAIEQPAREPRSELVCQ